LTWLHRITATIPRGYRVLGIHRLSPAGCVMAAEIRTDTSISEVVTVGHEQALER
jgi:hypothetical protein